MMRMKILKKCKPFIAGSFWIVLLGILLFSTGCGPKRLYPAPEDAAYYRPPTLVPTAVPTVPTPTAAFRPTQAPDCTNVLSFVSDITIEDGTQVSPGSTIDKRWKVKNDGTCNWDAGYGLVIIDGYEMGAKSSQALIPALSDTETTIRMVFTAPNEPGSYVSTWSAIDPDGEQFGDPVFIQIEVVRDQPISEPSEGSDDDTGSTP